MAKRRDLATQPKPRRIDKTQKVERQRWIPLENLFNFGGTGLLANQVDQLNDAGLRWPQALPREDDWCCKPVALKKLNTKACRQFVLGGGLHFFSNEPGRRVFLRRAGERTEQLGRELREIKFDERGQGQPAGI